MFRLTIANAKESSAATAMDTFEEVADRRDTDYSAICERLHPHRRFDRRREN